jgi:predicted Rossmann fold nucleotide-binding protein DprA/Smf involved in DNA uptake
MDRLSAICLTCSISTKTGFAIIPSASGAALAVPEVFFVAGHNQDKRWVEWFQVLHKAPASEGGRYELLSHEDLRHIDDIVETSGLNSSEVLATLFEMEMKGLVRQLPGKQFSKVLL